MENVFPVEVLSNVDPSQLPLAQQSQIQDPQPGGKPAQNTSASLEESSHDAATASEDMHWSPERFATTSSDMICGRRPVEVVEFHETHSSSRDESDLYQRSFRLVFLTRPKRVCFIIL